MYLLLARGHHRERWPERPGTAGKGDTTMYVSRSWGYRHPYISTGVRITAGTWNLLLGIILLSHGYRWGAALFAVSALVFWAAYILGRGKFGSRSNGHS